MTGSNPFTRFQSVCYLMMDYSEILQKHQSPVPVIEQDQADWIGFPPTDPTDKK